MNIKKILTASDINKIDEARNKKLLNTNDKNTSKKDIDFEAKEHHGSYADDERECEHLPAYGMDNTNNCLMCGALIID